MALAIIISGVMMIVLAGPGERVPLKKDRMYEVLGLFILFLVGVMLLSEGGHLAHIHLAGHAVEAMPKSTFYFVLIALVIVDIAQGRYQKKLDLERQRGQTAAAEPAGLSPVGALRARRAAGAARPRSPWCPAPTSASRCARCGGVSELRRS